MPINEHDKANIIEEETLRFQTRHQLAAAQGHCCGVDGHTKGRCCGALAGWIVAAILAVLLIAGAVHHCASCPMGMAQGYQAHHQAQPGPDEPGEAKAKK